MIHDHTSPSKKELSHAFPKTHFATNFVEGGFHKTGMPRLACGCQPRGDMTCSLHRAWLQQEKMQGESGGNFDMWKMLGPEGLVMVPLSSVFLGLGEGKLSQNSENGGRQ